MFTLQVINALPLTPLLFTFSISHIKPTCVHVYMCTRMVSALHMVNHLGRHQDFVTCTSGKLRPTEPYAYKSRIIFI